MEQLEGCSGELDRLEAALSDLLREVHQQCGILSKKRSEVGGEVTEGLARHLEELGLPKARLQFSFAPPPPPETGVDELLPRLGPSGYDQVELLISLNPGEELKPLKRVASGGERSRLMLALKRLFSERHPVPTMVFDEIDTGIGGMVADAVGAHLKELSRHKQVICITHLAQIARQADLHFGVEKRTTGEATVSTLRLLDKSEKVGEIARMIAGSEEDPAARKHARRILAGDREALQG
jgi:DNA repair protein RecN (Recombination protein N)